MTAARSRAASERDWAARGLTAATVTARAAAEELIRAQDTARVLGWVGRITQADGDRIKDALRAYEQATWVEEER